MTLPEKYKSLFQKYGLNSKLRIPHFMAQIEHESGLKPISENLNYSAKRMLEIFKSDFDTNRDKWLSPKEKEKVLSLLGHPDRIANFVYANQNGNGNEQSGEGWKYRGRGFIQITGKENYFRLSNDTDIDFLNNPDLLYEYIVLTEPSPDNMSFTVAPLLIKEFAVILPIKELFPIKLALVANPSTIALVLA